MRSPLVAKVIWVIAKHDVIEMSIQYRYNIDDSISEKVPAWTTPAGPCRGSGRGIGANPSAQSPDFNRSVMAAR
ncbi:hypothetical protein HNP02_008528 [Mycobacterium sp. AZCC_0083]|nr:hypothetical protein [Mycobacterium sp. AZCC_0083]